MARKDKQRDDERTVELFDEEDPVEEFDDEDDGEQQPEDEDESDTTKDMRLIVGVLAHKLGINAVEPSTKELAALLADIDVRCGEAWDLETITLYLRQAQMEVLTRQIRGKE